MSFVRTTRLLGAFAVVVALCLTVTGCGGSGDDTTSEGFCCTTAESCAVIGAALSPCTDPAAPFCDDLGDYGPPRTCIPEPADLPACEGPADCSVALPFCVDGECEGCEGDGDCGAQAPVCEPTALACQACTIDADCTRLPDTSRCDLISGGCVECLTAVDCGAPTAAVCDDTYTCRGCQSHSECASELCDQATGACVAESLIIYVATTGTANATCTRAMPCATIAQGLTSLSPTRQLVKIRPGTYEAALTFNGITATLIGPDAVIQVAAVDTSPVTIGANSVVTFEGVTIRGANGPADPSGVNCQVVTPAVARLTLRSVLIEDNAGTGVYARNGCELYLERSTIRNNLDCGVLAWGGAFSIVNNVIAGNGGTSNCGGVYLNEVVTAGQHEVAFNTITENTSLGSSLYAPGIHCRNAAVPIAMANNIAWANGETDQVEVTANAYCTHTYSDVGPTATTGITNMNFDPGFVSVSTDDFHLGSSSPARDAADPAATEPIDFDGDLRPQGLRADIGADEILP